MMSQPGQSSYQVFIAGIHLEQREECPLISDAHRTAQTIRGGVLAWHLIDQSDLHIVHFARVR